MGLIINPFGFGAAGGGSIPTSNLQLWFKADSISASDGDQISTWNDSSGNARNATGVARVTNKPLYKINQINSTLPAVRFQDDGYFTLTGFMSGVMSSGEAFFVAKVDADPGSVSGPLHASWGSDPSGCHYPFAGDGNVYDTFGTSVRKTISNPTDSLTAWRTYNVRSATNAWSAHLDGTQIHSTATNTTGWGIGTHFIGRNSGAQTQLGYIAEIILYSAVLSSADRWLVHGYLNTKYGFSLPTS